MNRLLLLGRSLRHTPPKQVLARLRLITKRRWSDVIAKIHVPLHGTRRSPPASPQPPEPLFSPRAVQIRGSGEQLSLDVVGTIVPYAHPMNWRPEQLERGSLEMLTLHYTEFLEGVDNRESVMLDWIAENPIIEIENWRDAWNSYAISIRCVVWMQQMARNPALFSDSGLRTINNSLAAQIRFLEQNLELDIRGNHLIKNLKCLMWAGRFFEGSEADSWYGAGSRLLDEAVAEQVLDDGMHFERSASYHNQVLADLAECYWVMDDSIARKKLGITLDHMAQVSVDLTHPDGYPSMMNDGGFDMAYSASDIQHALVRLGRESVEQQPVIHLPDAGYYGIRGADSLLLIDCGPIGPDALPAHAHGDILSFEWSIKGERVIVDPGVFEYRAGDWRAYARSTSAHNTVTVAMQDQAEFWSSFRVGRRPRVVVRNYESDGTRITLTGSHNGFSRLSGGPIHYRTFEATDTELTITDRVEGGQGQPVMASLLLSPSLEAVEIPGAIVAQGHQVTLQITGDAEISVEKSQYSTNIGNRQTTTRIVTRLGLAPTSGHITISIIDNAEST